MKRIVARGVASAPAELAHSVHVEVDGRSPGRDYFYQFNVRGDESPIGHLRTAPHRHEMARESGSLRASRIQAERGTRNTWVVEAGQPGALQA